MNGTTPGNVLLRKQHAKCRNKTTRYKKSSALQDLEKLSFQVKRLKYPSNPYLVGDTFRDDTANGLTKAIIAYIRLKGGQAERINSTGRPIDRTKTFTDVLGNTRMIGRIEWIPGTSTNGTADISATIKGRSVKIETKIGSDRQSPAQKEYQKAVQTAFGIYFIARTFEEFKQWFDRL